MFDFNCLLWSFILGMAAGLLLGGYILAVMEEE